MGAQCEKKFPTGVCVCVCVCLVRRNYQRAFVFQMRRVCSGDTFLSITELSLELPLGWACVLVGGGHPGRSQGQTFSVEAAGIQGQLCRPTRLPWGARAALPLESGWLPDCCRILPGLREALAQPPCPCKLCLQGLRQPRGVATYLASGVKLKGQASVTQSKG